jgi:hypothetical protein
MTAFVKPGAGRRFGGGCRSAKSKRETSALRIVVDVDEGRHVIKAQRHRRNVRHDAVRHSAPPRRLEVPEDDTPDFRLQVMCIGDLPVLGDEADHALHVEIA